MDRLLPLKTGKHYTLWSRKGRCPGCDAGCGSKHMEVCHVRSELLAKLNRTSVVTELMKMAQNIIKNR